MSDSRLDWWPPLDGSQQQPTDGAGAGYPQAPEPPRRSRSRDRERRAKEQRAARRGTWVGIVTALVLLAGVVYVGFSLLGGGGDKAPQTEAVEDYPGPGYSSATVVINSGDTGADMARTLVAAGVVATEKAFTDAFAANPEAAKIQPGTYSLLLKMPAANAVVALLTPASRVSIKVTIPEGWNVSQIVTKVNEVTLIPVDDLQAALADPASIGLPAEAGGKAEGWLYPATYQFDPKATAKDVLGQMVAQTLQVLQSKGVPQDQWMAVLTKASLIEREAGRDEDRAKISRVIDNRLAQEWPLDIDATILYGLGRTSGGLTDAELQDAGNPYNTRQHKGLPPTPIASPGEKSIDAALHPEEGDWMFWVTVNFETKETKFAVTLDEHDQYVAEMNAWLAAHTTTAPTPQ